MYAFNAIQIVGLYASLPWLYQLARIHEWYYASYGCVALGVIGSIFLVVGATNNLYAIDRELRN